MTSVRLSEQSVCFNCGQLTYDRYYPIISQTEKKNSLQNANNTDEDTQLGKSFKFDTYKVRIVTNGGPPIKHPALYRIFVKTTEVMAEKSF